MITLHLLKDGLMSLNETGTEIPVYNPSTEAQIGEIVDGGASAVDAAVARARETFQAEAWTGKGSSERAKIIWEAADLIQARADKSARSTRSLPGIPPHPSGGGKQSGWVYEYALEGVEAYMKTKLVCAGL